MPCGCKTIIVECPQHAATGALLALARRVARAGALRGLDAAREDAALRDAAQRVLAYIDTHTPTKEDSDAPHVD